MDMMDNGRIAIPVSAPSEASHARRDPRVTVAARERFSWTDGTAAQLRDPPFQQAWLDLVRNSQGSNIYVHPAVVLAMVEEGTPVGVCTQWTQTPSEPPSLSRLAILASKTYPVRLVSSFPLGLTLHGRQVLGNHLFGSNSAGATAGFVEEVVRWLHTGAAESEFVLFEDVEVGTPLWGALLHAAKQGRVLLHHPNPPQLHWWLDFPADVATFWRNLSSKSRSTLRRRLKKLPHTLRCFQRPEDVQPFLAKASEISRRSWQAKRLGLRIRHGQRQVKILSELAAQGALRCYILESDNKPVAFEYGTQWQGTYWAEETGYDQALATYSPGIILLYRFIEDLLTRDPPQRMDFGPGDSAYKHLVSNRQTLSGPVLLMRRDTRSRLALTILRSRSSVSGLLRAALRQVGLLAFLRARYRK